MSISHLPYKLMYCYSHEDKSLRDFLGQHMKPLEKEGYLETWCDREITAGSEWNREIDEYLEQADIILLLVSSSFIDSDYCYNKEMKRAIERHERGEARVIPVIMRSVFWKIAPFQKLQILPRDGRPITTWGNQDEAYAKIVEEIYQIIEKARNEKTENRISSLLRKQKNILDDKAIENIYGSAIKIVHFDQIERASQEKIHQYYEGAQLDWSILEADGDVQRDQTDELVESLAQLQQLHTVCLSGEPGSGKSTLAWRIARELAKKTRRLLLHVLDMEANNLWSALENIVLQYEVSLIILVDDIFRNPDVLSELRKLNADLPVIVIATSRSNEVPENPSLPGFQRVQVQPPSLNEKNQVLQKLSLDKKEEDLRKQLLQKANSWLVMMVEMTTGENLSNIIKDNIDRLFQQDSLVYRAYGYLCYAGQYDIGIPETLLISLAGQSSDICHRPASRDLFFIDDERGEVRTQHSTIARQALRFYKEHSVTFLANFLKEIDPNRREHRKFIMRLLRALVLDQQESLVQKMLIKSAREFTIMQYAAGSGELLYDWADLYSRLRDQGKVMTMKTLAIKHDPETALDLHAHLKLGQEILRNMKGRMGITSEQIKAIDQIRSIIDKTANWLQVNSHDTDVRARYLGFTAQYGNSLQIEQAIKQTESWLDKEFPENVNVRQSYLSLVERSAGPEQARDTIRKTESWLIEHPENTNVRQAYLALVGKRGSKEQQMRALRETKAWLDEHPENTNVRQTYHNLSRRLENEKLENERYKQAKSWTNVSDVLQDLSAINGQESLLDIQTFLKEIKEWLISHPEAVEVHIRYLGLIKRYGTAKQKQDAIERIEIWLFGHPENTSVRVTYLRLIGAEGTEKERQRAINMTRVWLERYQSTTVYQAYLSLVERHGDREQIEKALEEVVEWLEKHPENTNVRQSYLVMVGKWGSKRQLLEALGATRIWLRDHPANMNVRQVYFNLTRNQEMDEEEERTV